MVMKTHLKLLTISLFIVNFLVLLQPAQCLSKKFGAPSKGGEATGGPPESEGKIDRKITIIVGEEKPIASSSSSLASSKTPAAHSKTHKGCRQENKKVESKFYLDESTKLIYIDKSNESGYLIGEINNGSGGEFQSQTKQARPTSSPTAGPSFPNGDRFHKNRPLPPGSVSDGHEGSNPTNYSVYIVSRSKDHIAIMIDIEEVDFEPIINCEYQELRFSIVGEISKQLLGRKNSSDMNENGESLSGSDWWKDGFGENSPDETNDKDGKDDEDGERSSGRESDAESSAPPLPVSEAMAMLLNAPLNKTILDESSETNDFKIIDSTIDFLHDETCSDLAADDELLNHEKNDNHNHNHNHQSDTPNELKVKRNKHGRKSSRQRQRKSKGSANGRKRARQQPETIHASCPQNSQLFKDLMISKLEDYFEWDDFKIICGKTRQLVIPMRSLKLSVYSDEFSPNSRFRLRYRFISDPSLLPAQDNGKYYCRNRNIIDLSLKCNSIDDCGDASDESIKVCGYPSGRSNNNEPLSAQPLSMSSSQSLNGTSHHSSTNYESKKRLTYVNGDVLHCCQSSDWMSVIPQGRANQMINLQSFIGQSMNLFSGPLFAPTSSSKTGPKGSHRRVKRIVGGGVAQRGAWPGQASLQYELLEPLCHFCAGTLIHPQYVLTAGHCITKDGLSRGIKVVFGAHDLRQLGGNHIQVRYVDDAQIYPGVDVKHLSFDWENDMNNDIALLRLNAPVLITPHVAPACLPPFNTPLSVNTTCRSIGWGQTHGSGSSNLLKHLSLKVVESSLCSKELFDRDNNDENKVRNTKKSSKKMAKKRGLKNRNAKPSRFVGDFETTDLEQYSDLTMVCVNNDLGHGICQGDSGGPLYCDRVKSTGEQCTEIYGVASFIIQYATVGAMCAVENLPGIFGEVSSKTEWISSTMKMFEQTYRLKYS